MSTATLTQNTIGKDHSANTLDVHHFLNHRHIGGVQLRVAILAFIVLILDGFDVVSIGFIIPALIDSWHVSREALGPVLVSGLVGLAVGAFSGGPIADIFGRRKVIIGSVVLFGIMSLASAYSPNLTVLALMRFLTGLGLGASQPNTGTLVSEFAPARHRSIFVTLTYCGFTVGAAAGGFLSAALLANYGWQSILVVGGIVPIIFAALCIFLLPESPGYLALHPARHARLAALLNKIEPGVADKNTQFITHAETQQQAQPANTKAPFLQILSKTHLPVTLMLWLGLFSTMLTVYLMNSWLPTLIKGIGFSIQDAATIGAMGQLGGVVGNIFIGWAMDRWESHKVVVAALLLAAVFAVAIGINTSHDTISIGLMTALIFGLGLATNCANTTWVPLATGYYSTKVRATGTGWMTAVGRLGAISGASAGAILLSFHLSMGQIFYTLCIPVTLGVIAALGKLKLSKGSKAVSSLAH